MNSERKEDFFFGHNSLQWKESHKEKNTINIFYSLGFSVLFPCFGNHSLKSITMSLESYYSTKLLYEHSNMQLDKNKTKFYLPVQPVSLVN